MGVRLRIKVRPGARQSRVIRKLGEEWKVEIAAPAVDGKANRALVEFLASRWRVPRSAVRIVSGRHSPNKVVEVDGTHAPELALLRETESRKS